jgi:hypothetical protein
MCGSLSVQSGSKPFGLWGITNGIRADLRGHRRVRVRCADMGFIARVDPTGARHDTCAGTGRTVAYAKRKRSWLSFVRLLVCWADEDIGSFEGGVVTPGFLKNKTRLIICVPRKSTHMPE